LKVEINSIPLKIALVVVFIGGICGVGYYWKDVKRVYVVLGIGYY
jgi:hypothetical protein